MRIPPPSSQPPSLSRRSLLGYAGTGGALAMLGRGGAGAASGPQEHSEPKEPAVTGGRLRQSVCRWCYAKVPLDELAAAAARLGLVSVELLDPKDFETVTRHGLSCAMVNSHRIERGLNDPANWDECLGKIRTAIEAAAAAGFPNVITFSGNRNGMPDDVGLEHCAKALRQVVGLAEQKGVTICMELLNSRHSHPDYMADRTPWGLELVSRVGSERFKLLYDIFHMQIMEGDVIQTIRDHHDAIAHYHTAGVPGRHELDEDQELYYPAIMRAIADTGYSGVIGQEFIPKGDDPIAALAHGVAVCDV